MKTVVLIICAALGLLIAYRVGQNSDKRRIHSVAEFFFGPAKATPTPEPVATPTPVVAKPATPKVWPTSGSGEPTPPPPEILSAVVTVVGDRGAGTGFFCSFRGKRYVATNQHVLAVGAPFRVRTSTGQTVQTGKIVAAKDADVALLECAALPTGATELPLAVLPDRDIQTDQATMVPGNTKGDGVITQAPGKLLAVGPQRVEVDNPVYPGNSGGPIIHLPTGRVIGILTEAEMLTLSEIERETFQAKASPIKSTVRYFGHRIDSVEAWEGLDWGSFQYAEGLIRQSREELDAIVAYFSDSSGNYKRFAELHEARNNAAKIYFNRAHSNEDKFAAYERFLREIDGFARRTRLRFVNQKIYFSQRKDVESINRISAAVERITSVARRDSSVAASILGHR